MQTDAGRWREWWSEWQQWVIAQAWGERLSLQQWRVLKWWMWFKLMSLMFHANDRCCCYYFCCVFCSFSPWGCSLPGYVFVDCFRISAVAAVLAVWAAFFYDYCNFRYAFKLFSFVVIVAVFVLAGRRAYGYECSSWSSRSSRLSIWLLCTSGCCRSFFLRNLLPFVSSSSAFVPLLCFRYGFLFNFFICYLIENVTPIRLGCLLLSPVVEDLSCAVVFFIALCRCWSS